MTTTSASDANDLTDQELRDQVLADIRPLLGITAPAVRIGGGQEVGMACDFSIVSDLAIFSQAGPKHGSAAIGGSTDFLPVMIGILALSLLPIPALVPLTLSLSLGSLVEALSVAEAEGSTGPLAGVALGIRAVLRAAPHSLLSVPDELLELLSRHLGLEGDDAKSFLEERGLYDAIDAVA